MSCDDEEPERVRVRLPRPVPGRVIEKLQAQLDLERNTVASLREQLAEARASQLIQIPRLTPGESVTIAYPGVLKPARRIEPAKFSVQGV